MKLTLEKQVLAYINNEFGWLSEDMLIGLGFPKGDEEYSPISVKKALSNLTKNKEIMRGNKENKTYYASKKRQKYLTKGIIKL